MFMLALTCMLCDMLLLCFQSMLLDLDNRLFGDWTAGVWHEVVVEEEEREQSTCPHHYAQSALVYGNRRTLRAW